MKRGLLVGMGLVLVGGVVTPAMAPMGVDPAAAATATVMPFDFDGDGFADLAVGVPGEDLRGRRDAGAVQVLYGSASGVTAHDQIWHQGRKGVKGALERSDRFGDALASGDFDADGYADLAIGIPGEGIGKKRDVGAVQVLYGGPSGLTASGDQVWHQGKRGVPGTNETGDEFGKTLAAGDFDADGYADLVIGAPMEEVGSLDQAGRVVVLRGGSRGLTSSGARLLRQGLGGIPLQPALGARFGADLAVGDVNGDGRDDLVIGVCSGPDIPEGGSSAVHLLWGSPAGLTSVDGRYIKANPAPGAPEVSFMFTFGDFNRDGTAALVLSLADGQVLVEPFVGNGFRIDRWSRQGGQSGLAVAAGDITGDGYPDLVLDGGQDSVQVILGSNAGLVADVTSWSVPTAENADLSVLRLSGGSHAWLAATNMQESVTVLRGTPAGTLGPVTVWSQNSPGIKGAAEPDDGFGSVIGG